MSATGIGKLEYTIPLKCDKHGEGVHLGVTYDWLVDDVFIYCPICYPSHPKNPVKGLSRINLFPSRLT